MKKTGKKFDRSRRQKIGVCMILILVIGMVETGMQNYSYIIKEKNQRKIIKNMEDIAEEPVMKQYSSSIDGDNRIKKEICLIKAKIQTFFKKNYSNGVYRGKKNYFVEDLKEPVVEECKKNIEAINRLAEKDSIQVYMMIVPNGAEIMKEYLPNGATVRNQKKDIEKFSEGLCEDVKNIDVVPVMEKFYKKEQLYYRNDHRWTSQGAYRAFLKAADILQIQQKPEKYEKYKITDNFSGTLTAESGYDPTKKDEIEIFIPEEDSVKYLVKYQDEKGKKASVYDSKKIETRNKYDVFMGGNHTLTKIETTKRGGEKILVVKDSYANCFIPFLIPYYREIYAIDPRYYHGEINKFVDENNISNVMFLYDANTLFQDHFISSIIK